ncbi:glycosyltransferase [Candidatus Saccharibacteria bacterium]|nr:glycosyltransferase [Candidatus Saccharibacteria bacterium]
MKVAIVCDWLTSIGGAERVLRSISDLFPNAPIYTSQYNEKKIDWFKDRDVRVGWLQTFPTSFRRFLGPLRQKYFSSLDLSGYDLIISVTGAEAKSIKKGKALHLCYCHVPTQYYWGMKDEYLKNPGFGVLNPVARLGLKTLLPPLKKADFEAAQLPDEFITISTYAAEQIKSAYKRESTIIFPPVAVEKFSTREFSTGRETIKPQKSQAEQPEQEQHKIKQKSNNANPTSVKPGSRYGFVTTSRQVNWKRLDLAIKACIELKLPLTVIGEGPEHGKLKKLAHRSRNIKFLPLQDQKSLKRYLESAEGYIFPSLEPFGIAPVEALACGCPVIAYGNGGALDYVIDGENGILFGKQSVNSLRQALKRFSSTKFDEERVRKSALPFQEKYFKEKMRAFITAKVKEHQEILSGKVKKENDIKPKEVKSSPVKPTSWPTEISKSTTPMKPAATPRPTTAPKQPKLKNLVQSTKKPVQPVKKPTESVKKPAQPAKRPIRKLSIDPVQKKPTQKPAQKPVNKPVEKPTGKQPTKKPTLKPDIKPPKKSTLKPDIKPAKKTAKKTARKSTTPKLTPKPTPTPKPVRKEPKDEKPETLKIEIK